MEIRSTTILAVKRNGKTILIGDGQVTLGQQIVFKNTAGHSFTRRKKQIENEFDFQIFASENFAKFLSTKGYLPKIRDG